MSAMESHPSPSVSKKASAHRGRAPGLLRVAPIDPGQKIAELRRRDRHHPIGRARPDEAPPLQPLGEEARPVAVMPDHFQEITATAAAEEQMAPQDRKSVVEGKRV